MKVAGAMLVSALETSSHWRTSSPSTTRQAYTSCECPQIHPLRSIPSSATSPYHRDRVCCWTGRPLDFRPATPRVDKPRQVTVFVFLQGCKQGGGTHRRPPIRAYMTRCTHYDDLAATLLLSKQSTRSITKKHLTLRPPSARGPDPERRPPIQRQ
jgi:hypothetical protein